MINRGITFKFVVLVCLSGAVAMAMIIGYSYTKARITVMKDLREDAKSIALSAVKEIEAVLNPIEKAPECMADFLGGSDLERKSLLERLRSVVESSPEVLGAAAAFEPYAFDQDSFYFAPYFYDDGGEIKLEYRGGEDYRYFYLDWYQVPAVLNRPVWGEPYYDEGNGGIMMSSYSVPLYAGDSTKRKLMGVATAEIALTRLQGIVDSLKVCRSGYGFLLSRNGTFIFHPDERLIMKETVFGLAKIMDDSAMYSIGRKMVNGKSGLVSIDNIFTGGKCWIYYSPIPSSGWSLGVLFPDDELMSGVTRLTENLMLLGLGGICLLVLVVGVYAWKIAKPLRSLAEAAEEIGAGELDYHLPPVKSRDEVGRLNQAFGDMVASLKSYVNGLSETVVSEGRIEDELKAAQEIQRSILPGEFEDGKVDIFAVLKPVSEVGGDYYDFFTLGKNRLCFTIGDVAGRGIPAVLHMADIRNRIRHKAGDGLNPAQILTSLNQDLCREDSKGMFVTIFLGILDLETGEMDYCSAGHETPLIILTDGTVDEFGKPDELVMGVESDYEYKVNKYTFKPGEILFLFTNGVIEAMDKEGTMFFRQRLKETLKRFEGYKPEKLVKAVLSEVKTFTSGVEQSDDMAMLTLKYNGSTDAE